MGTTEAAGDEERFSCSGPLLDQFRHAPGRVGVNQLVLDRLERVPVPTFARIAIELAFGGDAVGETEFLRLLRLVDDLAIGRALFGHVPALRHVAADVQDLADAGREVTLLAEILRQEHGVLQRRRARRAFVAEHPRLLRPPPAQERDPRGTAHRVLAVRPVKPHRPHRQPVHIWSLHDRVAVTGQTAVQVVRNDEQHVGTRCRLFRSLNRQPYGPQRQYAEKKLDRSHARSYCS